MRPTDPRLLRQLAPARRPLALVLVAGALGGALVVVQAFVLTGLVVAAVHGDPVGAWVVAVAGLFGARALVGYAGEAAAARAASLVSTDLRRRLTGSILQESARGGGRPSGELAVLATRGVAAAEPYLTRYLPALALAAVVPALTVVAIASQDLLSAAIVLATLPLVPLFGALVGLATRDQAATQWRAMASLSGHFLDVVRGLPTLVAFRRAESQSATIASVTDRYRRATLRTLRVAFASSAVLELVATMSVALVAVTVGLRLGAGHLDLRTALVVLLLAPEAYWPLRRVGAEFHAAAEGTATLAAMAGVGSPAPVVRSVAPAWAGPIEVSGLSVTHPGRTTPTLRDLDATFPARGVTCVTGPSGCGKSTLLATLAGLLDPASGQVAVGGDPVGGASWQAGVAYLPQRPVFLTGTIAANLRLARPGATDADLWSVLREVALEERVRALAGGLDALLGEDGATLSAGERARLALARVVLADRPWVLLDEPTAHLDAVTEQVIADTIVALGRRSGVVVVAHRDALVRLADHRVELPVPVEAAATPVDAATPRATAPAAPAAPDDGATLRHGLLGSTLLAAGATGAGVALTATAGWLIVRASEQPPVLALLVAIVGVRAFGLARPVLRYAERLRSHDVALRLLAARRVHVYDVLVPLTPGRLGRRRGDLLASVVDDVDAVVDRELRVRLPLWSGALVVVGATAFAAVALPVAGLLVLVSCLVAGAVAFGGAAASAARVAPAALEARAALSAYVVESTQLATELLMWQATAASVETVAGLSGDLTAAGERGARGAARARAAVLVLTGAAIAAMAVLVAGSVSGPVVALLVLLPLALAEVLLPLVDAGSLSVGARAADARLRALEALAPMVADPVAPASPGPDTTVAVTGVDAGWGAHPALRGVSLELTPGRRLGVVGPSGSGKSTLAALLLRFVDPRVGEVTTGGVPLPALLLDDVRRRVGLVDDDPHVFATTVVENVRLARPDASDEEVATALRQACLGPWLDALPDGLDTWLGDGHAGLSGGERARLALARSLLADQPVLVLDEPTAHLDAGTARDVAAEVLAATTGRSVVWITHGTVGLEQMDDVLDLGLPVAAAGVLGVRR